MARILIAGVKVPFVRGGQDVLVKTLCDELKARSHEVDTVELPLSMLPKESIINQIAMWRLLNLNTFCGKDVDLVIATKFPTYYLQHPRKSLWLVHQHRAIYDLYGGRYSDISDDPRDEELRKMLVEGDKKVIGECVYRGAISKNVAERLKQYNDLEAEVLYPPLKLAGKYYNATAENYILSVGRICSIKRVDLMVKALTFISPDIKLKIVGKADEPEVLQYINNEIDKHHLWERVEFLGGVDDDGLLSLYARSLAVYYAPFDEDYGYVTLEAMASGKPVITAKDSGGVLEFIRDGETGVVQDSTPESIGCGAMRLIEDRTLAAEMGKRARSEIERIGLATGGWDSVINGLLSPLRK